VKVKKHKHHSKFIK